MIFKPGFYYVGDPGFVLPNVDLRTLFARAMSQTLSSGPQELIVSRSCENGSMEVEYYWLATTPFKTGTLYDQDKKGWGIDWGCFGIVPWKWIECQGSYEGNKIEFKENFKCVASENEITIGHLSFKF